MSIFHVIRDQAARQPDRVALEDAAGSTMTYHALMESVSAMAGTLRADGVVATNRIALVLPNGPEMIVGTQPTSGVP